VDLAWKLDGVDLMPHLTGANTSRPHERLYWRFGEQWAVRQGDYKLVVSNGGSGKPELYNLAADRSESKDLASAEPDKAKELQALWNTWSAEQAEPSAVDKPAGQNKKKTGGKNKKKAAAAE
jgi:arylsulfatase A-like enzyme